MRADSRVAGAVQHAERLRFCCFFRCEPAAVSYVRRKTIAEGICRYNSH